MSLSARIKMAGAAGVLVILAACGSLGTGSGTGTGTGTSAEEIRGTVDSVDLSSHSVLLTNVNTYNANLNNSSTVRLYWNDQTYVDYNGTRYSPADLERGDQISARVGQSGSQLVAQSMTVLYDSSSGSTLPGGSYPGGSTYPGGTYGSTLRGTVQSVDTGRRTIQIDRGTYGTGSAGQYVTVLYDANTVVQYSGRQYRPEDLDRGDEVDVTIQDLGTGRLLAQSISVVRDVNSGSGGTTSTQADLRGTVRSVDTSRRTIELEQASWAQRFTTGGSSVVVLQYDSNTTVEYQGGVYAPTNLERGDVVDVQVRNQGSGLYALRIMVVRNVNG